MNNVPFPPLAGPGPTRTGTDGVSNARVKRTALLCFIYFLAAMAGARAGLFDRLGLLDLGISVGMTIAVTWWCLEDARLAGKPIGHSFYLVMLMAWPIAAPVYLLWARRLRGAALLALLATTLLITNVAAGTLAYVLFHGVR